MKSEVRPLHLHCFNIKSTQDIFALLCTILDFSADATINHLTRHFFFPFFLDNILNLDQV